MDRNIFEDLQWRGLVHSFSEGTQEVLATRKLTLYNGFDPTADSLHVGHLLPVIQLARFQRYGHTPIALAGGGTGMIGDPSGKSEERNLLTLDVVRENVEKIRAQMAHYLDFEVKSNPARLMNNADWLLELNLVAFLRDIGKHFTINYMLSKDSVRNRLDRESGLSFTEFSYMLLQSYDFLHLHDTYGCELQCGGSDQWGNITAGAELIRRYKGEPAFALVYPLLLKADGTKFGKTAGGSVWLSAERTSPYRFYQYWFNADDKDVITYLKQFTFIERPEIEALEASLAEHPEQREAQRVLARTLTHMTHGETALARAEQAAQALFGGDIRGLTSAEIEDIFADVPSSELARQSLEGEGVSLVDLLSGSGVVKSKGEARRAIEESGVYLNNQRAGEVGARVTSTDAIEGRFLILRRGRKNYHLVKLVG
jgi:tyrosyl-tRNA synthetase